MNIPGLDPNTAKMMASAMASMNKPKAPPPRNDIDEFLRNRDKYFEWPFFVTIAFGATGSDIVPFEMRLVNAATGTMSEWRPEQTNSITTALIEASKVSKRLAEEWNRQVPTDTATSTDGNDTASPATESE